MTKDSLKEQMRPQAVKRIETRLVLEAVAEAEKLEVTDERLEEEIQKMAEAYKMEAEKLKEHMGDAEKKQMKQDIAVFGSRSAARLGNCPQRQETAAVSYEVLCPLGSTVTGRFRERKGIFNELNTLCSGVYQQGGAFLRYLFPLA